MNVERLLEAFDRLGDEPETVHQFRKLVVGLAMSGKLVAPDEATMVPASFLKQLEAKKRILVQQGVLRKQSPLIALSPEELPKGFTNPSNFVRLGEIARIEKGQTGIMKAEPGAYPLVVTAEERGTCDHFDFDGAAAIVPLVSSAGHGKASLQRLHYQEGKFALGSILAAIIPHAPELISARFLFEYLTSFKEELLVSQMIGTANVSLSIGKVSDVPVPLVSPVVQRKVDELMGLCDRLEAARASREATRDRLAAASLARLNAPDATMRPGKVDTGFASGTGKNESSPAKAGTGFASVDAPEEESTFRADARFALDALPALTTRPDQIKALRQTILNLAVCGKLVPQDANDKAPRLPPLRQFAAASGIDDEVFAQFRGSMTLPSVWQIAPLAQLSENIVDCPQTTPKWTQNGEICIRTNQLRPRALDLSEPRYVSPESYRERIERLEPKADDILYSREGGILGIACRVPPAVRLCLGQRLMLIRAGAATRADFLEIVLNSPFITDIARARTTGGAAPRANMSTVRGYPIPVPPLAEQHRIVAKVDALMALCDRLEASLTAATTRRRLLDALLAEALAPVDAHELEPAE